MPKPDPIKDQFLAYDRSGKTVAIIVKEVPNPDPEPPEDSEDWEWYTETITEWCTAIGNRPLRYGSEAETNLARESGLIGSQDDLLVIESDDTLLRLPNRARPKIYNMP